MTASRSTQNPGQLMVCELFRSLQGETTLAGQPATFLRLSGCNLRCRWCDTTYAYEAGERQELAAVVSRLIAAPPADLIVVTGGEPLLQAGVPRLLEALVRAGRRVLVETNGSQDVRGLEARVARIVDLKCPSSGEAGSCFLSNLEALRSPDELKLVIADRADFRYGLEMIRRHDLAGRCALLCSPVADELEPATLAAWILAEPEPLRLQLQLHRLIWPDTERGV